MKKPAWRTPLARPTGNGRASVAPNLLERQFHASAPNQKWAADFTYVWTAEGWLFVAVVLDLYSRRVVGWSMQSTMTAQLVMDALLMAILRRGRPEAVLHHSDQGSQYTSEDFQRLLEAHGITCSMSRKGDCWDIQYTMEVNDRPSLTRAGIGQRALALTCRLRPERSPRVAGPPSSVT